MATRFQIKRSSAPGNTPTLSYGELAVNAADQKLFVGNNSGGFFLIASGLGGSNTAIQFNDSGVVGGTSGFTFDKTSNNVFVANTITVGSNVSLSTVSLFMGNSTVNSSLTSSTLTIGNTVINSTSVSDSNIQRSSLTLTTTGSSAQLLDSWGISAFRSADYVMQIKDNSANGHAMSHLQLLNDGTNPKMAEYGQMFTNGALGSFSANANTTAIRLYYTPISANTTIKASRVLITV
jgi:hypothetical protein